MGDTQGYHVERLCGLAPSRVTPSPKAPKGRKAASQMSEEGGEDVEDVEEHFWATAHAPRVGVGQLVALLAITPAAQRLRARKASDDARETAPAATVQRLIHTICLLSSPITCLS